MANKISVLIDVATDKAVSGLKGFKQSIGDADGAVNKFKAGASGAFNQLKAHAGQFAVVAGAAFVTFGVKAVAAFQDTALSAGKFADATGLSTEVASRWVAVADDIGISGASMEKAFGKLAQSIGKNNPLLEQYGITVQKGADGQDDMNATMLHAVDVIRSIQDPTKKAAVAQAALGKGWMEMSELIEQGSGSLTASMAEVSDAQVIDPAEVEKARKMRESLDELQDSVRDVALVMGEDLVPMASAMADGLTKIIGPLSSVNQWSKDVATSFLTLTGIMGAQNEEIDPLVFGYGRMASSLDVASGAAGKQIEFQEGMKDAALDTAEATEEVAAKTDDFAVGLQNLADTMSVQADAYADNALAALGWMGEVDEAMDTAAGSISTFSDEALADIDTFQQELSDNVAGLAGWQSDIVSIAAQTSPEFAGFLAEMGLAGSDLVSDLEGNKDELATTFEQWKLAAAVAARDVPGEIAKADPETQRIIERLGKNVIDTLGVQVAPTKAAGRAVGQAIVDGMRSGVTAGAREVGAAAVAAVTGAANAAKSAINAHSPSQLFADEIGRPIVWGIVKGIDEEEQELIDAAEGAAQKLVDGFAKAIESSKKDALDAVDDMVDEVADRFDDIWDVIGGRRDVEGLTESVSDAEIDLAEAHNAAAEAAAEFGAGSAEHVKALERVDDAIRKLQDANFRLLKASQELIDQGPAGEAAFAALGYAAGLEATEIFGLIGAYRDLVNARASAIAQQDQIRADADAAQNIQARFGQAAAAGLANEWIDHIAQFAHDPAFQLELMRQFLATVPGFATGGVVSGPPGSPQLAIVHGGEEVLTPAQQAGANGHGGSSVYVTVNAGMGADGREIGDVIVDKLREYERRNGTAWRR